MKKILAALILSICVCGNGYSEDIYKDQTDTIPQPVKGNQADIEHYTYNVPKQLDCQNIKVDERWAKGRVRERRVCFYRVTWTSMPGDTIMWNNIDTGEYGFVVR